MNEQIAPSMNFIGVDTKYPTAEGKQLTRIHMDGAASPLASESAVRAMQLLLPHYSNTHSYVHNSAKVSTHAMTWAHQQVLNFVDASAETYTAVFSGSGTTAAVNRVARGLHSLRPEKPVVLVSSMEHHANDLPHRQFGNRVRYIPLTGTGSQSGALDLAEYEALLKEHQGLVNYVAVSSVSNVTGISNPVAEMTRLAHQYDALILVDGAQSVAHQPTHLDQIQADFFIFSGHKLYAPASPGVLVAKRDLLAQMHGQDLGGGSVSTVSYFDFELVNHYPDREQSGTPNILGAVALANVMKDLQDEFDSGLSGREKKLINRLFDELNALNNVTVYGDHLLARTGALAFNHRLIDHGLLAAILNDYFAIAVRNECFCAHPYVSELLKEELWELDLSGVPEDQQETYINRKRGMVRASVSAYNSKGDISALIAAIREIEERLEEFQAVYIAQEDGSYRHAHYDINVPSILPFTAS